MTHSLFWILKNIVLHTRALVNKKIKNIQNYKKSYFVNFVRNRGWPKILIAFLNSHKSYVEITKIFLAKKICLPPLLTYLYVSEQLPICWWNIVENIVPRLRRDQRWEKKPCHYFKPSELSTCFRCHGISGWRWLLRTIKNHVLF